MPDNDYRKSHTGAGKGNQYDHYYETDPWQVFMWEREQEVIDALIKKYLGERKIALLDFACGTGRITEFLESRVSTCTGIDLSEPMLEVARNKLKRTEIINADLSADNVLADRKFNLITAFRFFTNAQPKLRDEVMLKLAQLLEPDGYLLFNNHHIPDAPFYRAKRMMHRIKGIPHTPTFRMMTLEETYSLIDRAGLEVVETRHVGFLHLPRIRFPRAVVATVESVVQKMNWVAKQSEVALVLCRPSLRSTATGQ